MGGLHTEMSFRGSIGYVMIGSGLQQLLVVIYDPNAVMHIMSGKAFSRDRREHLIVDAALHTILASHALGSPIQSQE